MAYQAYQGLPGLQRSQPIVLRCGAWTPGWQELQYAGIAARLTVWADVLAQLKL